MGFKIWETVTWKVQCRYTYVCIRTLQVNYTLGERSKYRYQNDWPTEKTMYEDSLVSGCVYVPNCSHKSGLVNLDSCVTSQDGLSIYKYLAEIGR